MKMKLIRILPAGNEYAMPLDEYSELPCLRIQDGKPHHTGFHYGYLAHMVHCGRAEVVGEVTLALTMERTK